MIERFASCAKSTVSLEDGTCQREVCVQLRQQLQELLEGSSERQFLTNRSELTAEINRQNRKIKILQKSKQVIAEELTLTKQELENTKGKLKKSESVSARCSTSNREVKTRGSYVDYSVVLSQKEEQLDLVCQELKNKQKELVGLRFERNQLKEQLQSKNDLLERIQASSRTQIEFYRLQLQNFEKEMAVKEGETIQNKKLNDELRMKEIRKWEQAVENYNSQMENLQKQLCRSKEKEQGMIKTIRSLQQQKTDIFDELTSEKEKTTWLTNLLEETKIQFMHSELIKLEKKDKTAKRKMSSKQKQSLSNQTKSFRSGSSASTTLTSAKTLLLQPNCTPVAPFRLSPHESSIFQPDWPNILDVSSNQF